MFQDSFYDTLFVHMVVCSLFLGCCTSFSENTQVNSFHIKVQARYWSIAINCTTVYRAFCGTVLSFQRSLHLVRVFLYHWYGLLLSFSMWSSIINTDFPELCLFRYSFGLVSSTLILECQLFPHIGCIYSILDLVCSS